MNYIIIARTYVRVYVYTCKDLLNEGFSEDLLIFYSLTTVEVLLGEGYEVPGLESWGTCTQDCGVDGPQSGPLLDVVIEPARRAVTHQTIVSSEVGFSVPLSARREWRSGG